MTDSVVRVADDVLVQQLTDGESVLLNMKDERYYGLNEVGTRMWESLIEAGTLLAAHEKLGELYEVDPDELWSDLKSFVSALEDAGLVEVEDV